MKVNLLGITLKKRLGVHLNFVCHCNTHYAQFYHNINTLKKDKQAPVVVATFEEAYVQQWTYFG